MQIKFTTCQRLTLSQILVFHGDVRHRGDSEASSDEPKILFSRGLEYFRFYHRCSFAFGVGSRRCARSVGITILQIGEYHSFISLFDEQLFEESNRIELTKIRFLSVESVQTG